LWIAVPDKATPGNVHLIVIPDPSNPHAKIYDDTIKDFTGAKDKEMTSLTFSDDGNFLAAATEGGTRMRVFDTY